MDVIHRLCFVAVTALLALVSRPAAAEDTIKLGYIEVFSGSFASLGDEALKSFGYILDKVNAQGGALGKKFELVPFDDKLRLRLERCEAFETCRLDKSIGIVSVAIFKDPNDPQWVEDSVDRAHAAARG